MNKSILILIMPILFFTPFITFSLNSWFGMWISMEINIMSFIPFMLYFNKKNKNITNKYFIAQVIGSSLFLMGIIFNLDLLNKDNENFISKNLLMNLGIMIKLGLPPFQNWFIDLMKNMTWINCMFLSNWQKIIPLMIFSQIYYPFLIYLTIMMCIILTFLGMNTSSIHLIMSFSSINQMTWLLMLMMINETSWKWYFIFYMIINISIMLIFKKTNIHYINELNNLNNLKLKNFIIILLLSISGLPPFFGFMIKLIAINNLNMIMITLFMMMMTLITFIMYTQICLNLMINFYMKNKSPLWNKMFKMNISFIEIYLFWLPMISWMISSIWHF